MLRADKWATELGCALKMEQREGCSKVKKKEEKLPLQPQESAGVSTHPAGKCCEGAAEACAQACRHGETGDRVNGQAIGLSARQRTASTASLMQPTEVRMHVFMHILSPQFCIQMHISTRARSPSSAFMHKSNSLCCIQMHISMRAPLLCIQMHLHAHLHARTLTQQQRRVLLQRAVGGQRSDGSARLCCPCTAALTAAAAATLSTPCSCHTANVAATPSSCHNAIVAAATVIAAATLTIPCPNHTTAVAATIPYPYHTTAVAANRRLAACQHSTIAAIPSHTRMAIPYAAILSHTRVAASHAAVMPCIAACVAVPIAPAPAARTAALLPFCCRLAQCEALQHICTRGVRVLVLLRACCCARTGSGHWFCWEHAAVHAQGNGAGFVESGLSLGAHTGSAQNC